VENTEKQLKAGVILDALKVYERAVEESRGDWMIRLNYGLLLTECTDLAGAEEQYKAALARLRHNVAAHQRLGEVALMTGRPGEAEAQFRESVRLAPNLTEPYFRLADALGAQGKVDDGLAIFEDRLRKGSDRAAVLATMGAYLVRMNRPEAARERLEEAARL